MFRQEQVEELDEQHAGSCGDDKSQRTEEENLDGIERQELTGLRGTSHRKAEQHHDHIVQRTTGRLGQTGGLRTFFQQITEKQHTQQRQA